MLVHYVAGFDHSVLVFASFVIGLVLCLRVLAGVPSDLLHLRLQLRGRLAFRAATLTFL